MTERDTPMSTTPFEILQSVMAACGRLKDLTDDALSPCRPDLVQADRMMWGVVEYVTEVNQTMSEVKGAWRGVCFTPGCTGRARWIAHGEAQTTGDYLSRYRCVDCCARVSTLLEDIQDLPPGEFYRQARRILDELRAE